MKTSIEFGLGGGSMVRKEYLRLADVYVAWMHRHAEAAQSSAQGDPAAEASLLTVLYGAMALEAATHELSETEFTDLTERSNFRRCEGAFKKPKEHRRVSAPIWRWRVLLERKGLKAEPEDAPLMAAQALFTVRNALVHYEADASPATITYEDVRTVRPMPGGGHRIEFALNKPPVSYEASLIEREINPAAALRHAAAAQAVFDTWNKLVSPAK